MRRGKPVALWITLVAATPAAAQQRTIALADAVRLSEQVQPRVITAQANLSSADARVRSARGQYLPSVSFSSSGSNFFSGGQARVDPSGQVVPGGTTSTSISSSLGASLDLFTGFRRGADVKAARATSASATASLIDARFQQRFTTTSQFFDALAAQQLVRVRDASVKRAEEQLKISVAKLHAGSATRSDSLRSLVTLGTAQLQLIQARTDLATAEANLARLIGASGRVSAADDSAFYQRGATPDTVAIRAEAVVRSPQIQAAQLSSAAARASLRSVRSGYWPTLTLAANTGFNGSGANDYRLFNQRQVGLQLNWNLFNRFTREQNIVIQEANLEVADANAGEAARLVDANLTTAIATLAAAESRITITGTSVDAAREDLRVVQERYRLGASTIVDVLISQEALTQAEVDVVTARFDYLRSKAQIEALIGRTL